MVQDIIGEIALVHGEGNVPRQRTVYYWLEDINAGLFELSNGKSPGRPREIVTTNLITKVKESIDIDTRQSVRKLGISLQVDPITIFWILTSELKLQKICSTWVPHNKAPFDNSKHPALMSSSQ